MRTSLLLLVVSTLVFPSFSQFAAPIITSLQGFRSWEDSSSPLPSWIYFNYTNIDPRASLQTTCSRITGPVVNESVFDAGAANDYFTAYHACDNGTVLFSLKPDYQLYLKIYWQTGQINPITGRPWPACWSIAHPRNGTNVTEIRTQYGIYFSREEPLEAQLVSAVC